MGDLNKDIKAWEVFKSPLMNTKCRIWKCRQLSMRSPLMDGTTKSVPKISNYVHSDFATRLLRYSLVVPLICSLGFFLSGCAAVEREKGLIQETWDNAAEWITTISKKEDVPVKEDSSEPKPSVPDGASTTRVFSHQPDPPRRYERLCIANSRATTFASWISGAN